MEILQHKGEKVSYPHDEIYVKMTAEDYHNILDAVRSAIYHAKSAGYNRLKERYDALWNELHIAMNNADL